MIGPFLFSRRRVVPTDDVGRVGSACDALQVREFEFFRLAYHRWFGKQATEAEIEPSFMRYLTAGEAPIWVRHLAREVADQAAKGPCNRRMYGLPAAPGLPDWRSFDPLARIAMAIGFALILIIVNLGFWR